MAISKKILKFLDGAKIKYETLKHRTVYTAFDKSKTLKVSEKKVGKTLILKLDGKLAMALISAGKNLDLKKFKKLSKAKKIDFVSEKLIKNKFKGVKVGAIPPFGILWKFPTFIDNSLIKEKEVILNSGDYNFSIRIKTKEIKKLGENLIFGNFSKKKK
jgi:Ala-tRNA(Pro) deacylase